MRGAPPLSVSKSGKFVARLSSSRVLSSQVAETTVSSSRKGLPAFFSFASRCAVQSQPPQAQGLEPFSSRHLRRSWASCTFTSSKYFFLQRCRTVADFHPADRLVGTNPRVVHVAQVFALGDRAFPQCAALNRFQQRGPATIFQSSSHQVSHALSIDDYPQTPAARLNLPTWAVKPRRSGRGYKACFLFRS